MKPNKSTVKTKRIKMTLKEWLEYENPRYLVYPTPYVALRVSSQELAYSFGKEVIKL